MTPLLALALPLLLGAATPTPLNPSLDGTIIAAHGRVYPTKDAGDGSEGFLAISNSGDTADTLASVDCPDADSTSLVDAQGKKLSNLTIPPMQTVKLTAQGIHLVLTATHFRIDYGTAVPCTLSFTDAGDIQVLLFSTATH